MEASPGWEYSQEWITNDKTVTTIVYGSITDDSTDPNSIIYKVNALTSAADTAGKAYQVALTTKGQRAVAVIVQEV